MGQPRDRGHQCKEQPDTGRRRWWLKGQASLVGRQILTYRPQRGAPEELIELGEVHDHTELVGLLGWCHLFACGHWGDAKLALCHIKCQLVVLHSIVFVQRVKVARESKQGEIQREEAEVGGGIRSSDPGPCPQPTPPLHSPGTQPRKMLTLSCSLRVGPNQIWAMIMSLLPGLKTTRKWFTPPSLLLNSSRMFSF